MPAFDPLDSDEENELDALSRNDGHASLQEQTQVSCAPPGTSGSRAPLGTFGFSSLTSSDPAGNPPRF